MSHVNTANSRSYSTFNKVVSQSQIVPTNGDAATSLGRGKYMFEAVGETPITLMYYRLQRI